MAKIEITGKPEDLERISIFLKSNYIRHSIVEDYGNHSKEETEKYQMLMDRV